MTNDAKRAVRILSVEDNYADAGLLRLYFGCCSTPIELFSVENGDQALEYLEQRNNFTLAPRPDLILLDLNLPIVSGKEVLRHIKKDDQLQRIPVLILSTSNTQEDISECYRLGANGFISKPIDLISFETMIKSIELFWLNVAHLPTLPGKRNPDFIEKNDQLKFG